MLVMNFFTYVRRQKRNEMYRNSFRYKNTNVLPLKFMHIKGIIYARI